MTDKEKLIHNWIEFQRTENSDLEWANDDFIDLANEEPEVAWECVNRVIEIEATDTIIAKLAEGPLEDLLAEHGAKFSDRIDELSKSNLVFARLIKQVWVEEMPSEVRIKVSAVQKKIGNSV